MRKGSRAIISILAREATLKRRLRRHLTSLGFHKTEDGMLALPGAGKDVVRTLHNGQRNDRLAANREFITESYPKLIKHFASGDDIDTVRISPVLQRRAIRSYNLWRTGPAPRKLSQIEVESVD